MPSEGGKRTHCTSTREAPLVVQELSQEKQNEHIHGKQNLPRQPTAEMHEIYKCSSYGTPSDPLSLSLSLPLKRSKIRFGAETLVRSSDPAVPIAQDYGSYLRFRGRNEGAGKNKKEAKKAEKNRLKNLTPRERPPAFVHLRQFQSLSFTRILRSTPTHPHSHSPCRDKP